VNKHPKTRNRFKNELKTMSRVRSRCTLGVTLLGIAALHGPAMGAKMPMRNTRGKNRGNGRQQGRHKKAGSTMILDTVLEGSGANEPQQCRENVAFFHPFSSENSELFNISVEISGISRRQEKKVAGEVQSVLRTSISDHLHQALDDHLVGIDFDFELGLAPPAYTFQIWENNFSMFFDPPAFRGELYYDCNKYESTARALDELTNFLQSTFQSYEQDLHRRFSKNAESSKWSFDGLLL
jgi:hypothetical protein